MKKISKINLITVIAFALLIVGLMTVGTIYDLQISHALVDLKYPNYLSTSIFGRYFEIIGEMPFYPIIAFAGAILYHNISRREKKAINYLLRALAIAGRL